MTGRPQDAAPSARAAVWGHQAGRFLAHVVWRTRVTGAEHVPADGPVLLAANHVSAIDGPLLVGASPRPLHVMVKQEMFTGLLGAYLRSAGQIPVDRTGGRTALQQALAVLRRGGAVGIFPEGNRGNGAVESARAGIAWLAVQSGAPVVPVAILGTRRTGEDVGHVPGLRRTVHVQIGAPVHVVRPDLPRRQAIAAAADDVRTALADLVAQAQERTGVRLPEDDGARPLA